ncbi:hypothetical protein PHG01_00259 [Streptococcus mutans PKUSS-HG01]|nr:hypothetical protein PHG01_00259 [Streptococcus mutans PKUSS-HG01]
MLLALCVLALISYRSKNIIISFICVIILLALFAYYLLH